MNLSSFGRRLLAAANGTVAGTIIGLGTAAFKNTGTSGNTVPLLDGANTASGVWTFSANPSVTGGAVSFPATQVASAGANDLDDYEEGTFTPTIDGTTTPGAGTYSVQLGRYTKIGRLVEVNIYLAWSAHTGTGNMIVSGLPFAQNASGIIAPVSFFMHNMTFAATFVVAYVTAGGTTITLQTVATGAGVAAMPIDTAAQFAFTASYTV